MAEEQPPVSSEEPAAESAQFTAPLAEAPAAEHDALAQADTGNAGDMPSDAGATTDTADQAAIDELLKQANFEDPAALAATSAAPDAAEFKLPRL